MTWMRIPPRPVAGLRRRWYRPPVSVPDPGRPPKAVPKELLPVVDEPALRYIVEEVAAAGITDVLLLTGRGKSSMYLRGGRAGDGPRGSRARFPGLAAGIRPMRLPPSVPTRGKE
jgi:hypothetical protein